MRICTEIQNGFNEQTEFVMILFVSTHTHTNECVKMPRDVYMREYDSKTSETSVGLKLQECWEFPKNKSLQLFYTYFIELSCLP